jgi:GNAT superfamily N-acetyltransferase
LDRLWQRGFYFAIIAARKDGAMQISHIKYFQHWIPIIAKWIFDEWTYVYPQKTFQEIQRTLISRINEREMPITLVAHDERGVLGTASLKASDLEQVPDLTPWLSSVYVHPDHRGEGIGTALANEIEGIAVELGFTAIHLFNPLSKGVFEKLGWTILKTEQVGGKEIAILSKIIRAGSRSVMNWPT